MQGQKGADLAATRRIYRRMAADLKAARERLADKRRRRPGYDESACLVAELVRSLEGQLAVGSQPPVGVMRGPWRQVCDEATAREASV